jgi:flagellar biogenesis protein FliO
VLLPLLALIAIVMLLVWVVRKFRRSVVARRQPE